MNGESARRICRGTPCLFSQHGAGGGGMTHFSTARVHTELLMPMAKVERVFTGVSSCWYGKINTRIKTNLTCPRKY